MRFYKGTYGKDTIESNALVTNLLKYPEIASTLTRQFPQYSVSYFVDGLGQRFASEDLIGENRFRWAILGRTNRPSTCTGTSSGTGVGLSTFSVEFEENYINPNDVVRFASGINAVAIGEPSVSAGGYTVNFRLQTNDTTAAIVSADVVAGITVGKIGTAFEEGSERGFETHVYPDWYENYIGITRKAFRISGSALTDVTWIEHNGQRLWFFTDEAIQRDSFMYENELMDWYGRTTVDINGNPTVPSLGGKPIISGDGLLAQIDASNVDTYSGALTDARLTDFLAQLSLNTGVQNNHWLVYTGTAGMVAFHNAMRELLYPTGHILYNAQAGVEMEIGPNFRTYSALGHKMTLVHAPIFDDPNVHSAVDPVTGYLKESFRMVFLNFGMKDGKSNIERKVKGAGGINRSMIVKYIGGMVNPYDQNQMMAATSSDFFSVEYLREAGLIVRNPLSCGQLIFA